MIYTLENEQLRIEIEDTGAQLKSVWHKLSGTEMLWQGDEKYWSDRATNLFPFCGRCVDDKYVYSGKTYKACKHGFARLLVWKKAESSADSVTLFISDIPETYEQYPFKFLMKMKYTLKEDTLTVKITVENRDEKQIIFSVGGHPGFNMPLEKGLKFEDYFVEFSKACKPRRMMLSQGLYANADEPFELEGMRRIRLRHDLFNNDAIFLTDTCGEATLKSEQGVREIKIKYPDMRYIGIWHRPATKAPYLCFEPWSGPPALADERPTVLEVQPKKERLDPGGIYENTYSVTVI